MSDANRCPKCNIYLLGEYCYTCNIDIRNYLMNNNGILDVFDEIFKKDEDE